MNKKTGNISYVFTLIVSFGILMFTLISIMNMLTPFIWYQKLNNVVSKYIYVVERFGYITEDEERQMFSELRSEGFDISKINFDCPKQRLEYGEPFLFEITYPCKINIILLGSDKKHEAKEFMLHVKKEGFSKI